MKHVLVTILDQTIGFYVRIPYAFKSALKYEFRDTTVHKEATLFDDTVEDDVIYVMTFLLKHEPRGKDIWWLEEVPDVEEFQAREDTW